MFVKINILYLFILLTLVAFGLSDLQKKNWEYFVISLDGNSSNTDLFHIDCRAELIKRGEYGISGTWEFKFDYADDEFIEFKSYRSATGGSQFKSAPFSVQKMSMKEHLATTYKKFFMKSLANCSNFPQATGDEIPMYKLNTVYTLDKCQVFKDNLPSYVTPGYYKIVMLGTGVVNFFVETLLKIELKS